MLSINLSYRKENLSMFQRLHLAFVSSSTHRQKVPPNWERDTDGYNLVVSTTSEGGQIHLNPEAILLTPTLYFDQQSASSLLKPTFTLFPQPALFGLPFFHWPSTSKFNAFLKMWPSSLLNSWPYQHKHCCHCQLIYSLIQTQHEHQSRRSCLVFDMNSTHYSNLGSFSPS